MNKASVKWTLSYAAVQFTFWFIYGAALAYASPYLLVCGLTNTHIGVVSAAACTLSVLLQPSLASYADRKESPSVRILLILMSALMLMATGLLILFTGKNGLLCGILLGLVILLVQLSLPLVNALGTESINAGIPLNFGIARAFGSIGYALMSFSVGQLLARKGAQVHPLALALFCLCFLLSVSVYSFHKVRTGSEQKNDSGSISAFIHRYPVFSIMLGGCVLIYVSHVLINNYIYQIVVSRGGTSEHMGIVMALAGLLEMITMFLFPVMLKKKESGFWFRLSGAFFALKALGTLLAASIPALYLVQLLQPMGWGLLTVSSVYYVNEIMQEQDRIKGQAYMTMSHTAATIFGSLIGGWLIDRTGVNGMLVTAVICGAAGTLIVWTQKQHPVSPKTSL